MTDPATGAPGAGLSCCTLPSPTGVDEAPAMPAGLPAAARAPAESACDSSEAFALIGAPLACGAVTPPDRCCTPWASSWPSSAWPEDDDGS